jgi:cell wall-associated NlpC family hydrolase
VVGERDVGSDEAARITSGVVEVALEAIGTPYVWGGTGDNGFDCSGLIQYSYGQFGIQVPRVSTDQLRVGREVETRTSSLRRGDILGFSGKVGGKSTHVGLYVGNGEFIHSSSSGVRISNLANPYWQQHFIEARRVVW